MIKKLLVIVAVLLVGALLFRFFIWRNAAFVREPECIDMEDPIMVYGINVDTLAVTLGSVKPNQNLSEILNAWGVSYSTIHELVTNAGDVYNARRLRAGEQYILIHTKGERGVAQQMIIEPSLREYIILHLTDSIYAERFVRPSVIIQKEVAGEINSSVYVTAVKNGGNPDLVNRLVDVFAWQIDFFRIQKGDKFKVIYEEELIAGRTVATGRIQAAYFEHFGKDYYAIYFDECSQGDYYDECGQSVRRAFLKAPLDYTRISSRFSGSRFHPVLKRFKAHLGTDYAAPKGTPIRTVGSGVVVEAQYKGGNGNYVKIRHNSTYSTQYLHMSKIATGIRPGVSVTQGQTIGYVGSTGLATGPHLCFRFWKNGQQVDPFRVDLPPAKPVDPSGFEEFTELSERFIRRLDTMEIPTDIVQDEAEL